MDANMEALAKHEKEIEAREIAYDNFVETVLASEVAELYETAKSIYNKFADNYGVDTSFEEFIGEQI